ncbi:hypothetical protein [Pedobacter sp. SYSU D00535]|uniref:hypothetical protein n=1 Tax=Pedobacter sp. SYSU D00535 TaxID=2810308 RepID=UPI001A962087|nr:hypothetical protein [Pedobacter sp. SYSU D00535]
MPRIFTTTIALIISLHASSQINMKDSTMQVIAYWNKQEKQTYHIVDEKFKVTDSDTTSRETTEYDVEITVSDSTANSFTVQWLYKNVRVKTDNKFIQKVAGLSEQLPIVFKTDEMGVFQEVLNWKEVSDYIKKATALLREEFKGTPKLKEITGQVEQRFSTKAGIEASAIKDIIQFHNFYGGKYTLHEEATGKTKMANLYGGEPFDAEVSVILEEMDEKEDTGIIKSWQTIDSKQVTEATYEYLKKMASSLGSPAPKREDLPDMTIEDYLGSSFHASSGWLLYSVLERTTKGDNITQIDKRTIELVTEE